MNYTFANLIIEGFTDEVRKLVLQRAVDVNQADEYGFNPIIEAAIANNLEIAKLLLDAGADPNLRDMTGGLALHWAVENDNPELCELLIKHGADVNAYSRGSEAPLVKAILRDKKPLQKMLLKHGADNDFAKDFIQTKLLAHRYELRGHIDLVDSEGRFTEINLEGFFLESTLGMVRDSLLAYINNYATKRLRHYFNDLKVILNALNNAQKLTYLLHYQANHPRHTKQVNHILTRPLIILPIGSAGHATTITIMDKWLMLCDRRQDDKHLQGIVLYKINDMSKLNQTLLKKLVHDKKPEGFFNDWLVPTLKLECLQRILIEPQMTGNCSWANVEASIPACLFLMRGAPFTNQPFIVDYQHEIIQLFRHWREWDKQRALHFMLHDFNQLVPARKASRAALLAALIFQRCYYQRADDLKLARRIVDLIKLNGLNYTLDNYLTTYRQNSKSAAGKNFKLLLERIEDELDDDFI